MRRLAPLALAAAVAAVVAGAAFGVQALALRQPHRGDLVAARALEQMTVSRVVTSVQHLEGEPTRTGVCVHAKIHFPGAPGRRWSAIVDSGELRLAEVRGHVRTLARVDDHLIHVASAVFALAGCPHFFSRRLVQAFAAKRRFALRDTRFRGRPAYALPFRAGGGTAELFVDRDSGRPLAVHLSGRLSGWSVLVIHRGEDAARLQRDVLRRLP
jgi:hypothetical protein